MLGYGVDITEISRVRELISRRPAFVDRFFSREEQEYMQKIPERVAGNFCVKEAFSKAIGTGIRDFNLKDVEVLRDSLGKPYLRLSDALKAHCETLGYTRFQVSISHCREYAMAGVIAEQEERR